MDNELGLYYDDESENSNYRLIGVPISCGDSVKRDRDEMLEHFPNFGDNDNLEVVLKAVKYDGYLIRLVSERLRGNKEIALAAVKNYGDALEYLSDHLRDDYEVVRTACCGGFSSAIHLASDRLKDDKDLMKKIMINGCSDALHYASDRLKADKELVMLGLKRAARFNDLGEFCFSEAHESLRDDEVFILQILNEVGLNRDIWEGCSNRVKKIMGKTLDANQAIDALEVNRMKIELENFLSVSNKKKRMKM